MGHTNFGTFEFANSIVHFPRRPILRVTFHVSIADSLMSTVVMRLSSQGQDVTQTSLEESSDDCKPKNVHQ